MEFFASISIKKEESEEISTCSQVEVVKKEADDLENLFRKNDTLSFPISELKEEDNDMGDVFLEDKTSNFLLLKSEPISNALKLEYSPRSTKMKDISDSSDMDLDCSGRDVKIENTHTVIYENIKSDEKPFEEWKIKNEEIDIKLEDQSANSDFTEEKDKGVKIEDMHTATYENRKSNKNSFEEWKIKNEEINIKFEDHEQSTTRMYVHCFGRKKYEYFPVQNENQYNDQVKQKHNLKMTLGHQIKSSKVTKCAQCDYQTFRRADMKKHILRHQNPEDISLFKCDRCAYQTWKRGTLKRHILRHQNLDEVCMFKCDQCDYKTQDKSNLRKHMRRHQNLEEVCMFKCDQCEYKTPEKCNLRRHIRRHQNPQDIILFKCGHCAYQTSEKGTLKRHILQHQNPDEVYKFQCSQCGFQTRHKSNLIVHILQHQNPKDVNMFKCGQCDYQSKQKGPLKRHITRQHGEVMFKCDHCGYQTRDKSNLRRHIRRHKSK